MIMDLAVLKLNFTTVKLNVTTKIQMIMLQTRITNTKNLPGSLNNDFC